MTAATVASSARGAAPTVTLRTLLDQRKGEGRRFSLDEAIAIIVPLCLDLKVRHDRGEKHYVHPSAIAPGPDGLARLEPALALVPTNPRDRMCMAPELQQTLAPGDARASVFSLGALLYELVTGEHIGPAMRRPKEIDPTIPDAMEGLLAKALVGDPAHRPDDLGALASAMHHVAPMKSIPPPDVDTSRLDHTESFDVDIRLSMLPPSEAAPALDAAPEVPGIPQPARLPNIDTSDPFGNVRPSAPQPKSNNDPTQRLGVLKERLESDPRPRYVVSKDKMDHGPFTAVELLQQITSNTFTLDHGLRDEISGQSHPIKDWEEFAPFAEQAALKREIVAEKKEVARVAQEEKTAGVAKSTIGIAIVVALVAVVGVFIFKAVGARNDKIKIADDNNALALDPAGSIKGQKRHHAGGGHGGGGGFPGGLSYEAALSKNNQEINIGGPQGGPDLTDTQLAGPMKNGGFLNSCGVPDSMHVTVKVAIKMGRAVGVSVYTTPPNSGMAACVDRSVRQLVWPANPKMDSFITSY